MNPVRHIRRVAAVLVGLAAAVLAATPAFATAGARSRRRIRGAGLRPGPGPVPHHRRRRNARLADRPDRRRRRPAGGRGGGPRGPGTSRPPASGPHGCLSHARSSRGAVGRRFWPGAPLRAGPTGAWFSFRRIVDVPFGTCVAALESGQLTRHDGGRRGGQGLVYGPVEHDRDCGTCRVQAHLARGPLRPPLRMRLQADHWSSRPRGTASPLRRWLLTLPRRTAQPPHLRRSLSCPPSRVFLSCSPR